MRTDTSIVPTVKYATVSMTNDEEIQKMVRQLIRSVTGTVCGVLEMASAKDKAAEAGQSPKDDDDKRKATRMLPKRKRIPSDATEEVDDVYTATNLLDATPLDATAVACLALAELLQLQDLYVRTRPFLLAPLWKSLCEVAAAISGSSNNKLPVPLWQHSVRALTQLLRDGLATATTTRDGAAVALFAQDFGLSAGPLDGLLEAAAVVVVQCQ